MKKSFTLLATLVALVLGLTFTSCDKEEDLYGCWQLISTTESGRTVSGNQYVYFSEDGKYYEATKIVDEDDYFVSFSCDFKFKRGYLKLSYSSFALLNSEYEASIDGDELTINWDGYTSVYKSCPAPAGFMEALKGGAFLDF